MAKLSKKKTMAKYTTESIAGPNQTTVIDLTGEIELNNNKTYTASIELTGESSHFKFNTTKGLETAFGFNFDEVLTSITLSGAGADIENAFKQIIYTSGQSVNDTFETVITSDFPDNAYLRPGGNFYKFFTSTASWTDARQAALNSNLFGAPGYLTNITTEDENSFIAEKVDAKNIWIGGSDEGHEGIWKWMDGPDDEKGKVFWQFDDNTFSYPITFPRTADEFGSTRNRMFASWSTKNQNEYGVEPNNSGVNGGTWQLGSSNNVGKTTGGGQSIAIDNENFIVTNFNNEKGMWNDSRNSNPSKINGYIVEYETSDMDNSITVATHKVLDATTSKEPLVNECLLEVGGSGAIELGPGNDRLKTNQYISADKLDGQQGDDLLILTNESNCDAEDFELDNFATKEMTIKNFETIKLESGRWAFGGSFKESDLIISGGSLRLTPSKRNSFALKASKSGIQIKELDDKKMSAEIEVSFEKINSNKLPGGRWRIASGINEKNFKRIEESIITTGLDNGIDDPVYEHKRNSIFAIFAE